MMQSPRPLEVLFLTDFSNASYRSIPALAQMADELEIRLTLFHACDGARESRAAAEAHLRSFFPEASLYHGSQRIVVPGKVIDAVKLLKQEQAIDLIVAPSSDPLGLPHPWHSSLRAELIEAGCGLVWTVGQAVHSSVLNRRTRNVGCWIDLDCPDKRHITAAFSYAATLGAKLHLLNAMPETNEGTLASTLFSEAALYPDGVTEEIQNLIGWVPTAPEVHVRSGSRRRVIPQLARELELDIMFVGKKSSLNRGLMRNSVEAAVDRCPCPVICSDGKHGKWHLKKGPALEQRRAARAA